MRWVFLTESKYQFLSEANSVKVSSILSNLDYEKTQYQIEDNMIFDAKDMTIYNCEYDDTNRVDERSKLAIYFQDQYEARVWE